jgi:protein SCO1/2
MNMKASVILCALAACVAALTASGEPASGARTPSLQNVGFYLPQPLPLADFKLVDQNGAPFTLGNLKNHWTLLAFGYTHCPDVCPMTMTQIRSVKKSLTALDRTMSVSAVFVSIDPQRDSAEQLKEYSSLFGNDFIGVGGEPREVDAFAKQLKVKYALAGGTSEGYFIDHTSSVALITPHGQLRALFNVPLRPDAVAADIHRLASASAASR